MAMDPNEPNFQSEFSSSKKLFPPNMYIALSHTTAVCAFLVLGLWSRSNLVHTAVSAAVLISTRHSARTSAALTEIELVQVVVKRVRVVAAKHPQFTVVHDARVQLSAGWFVAEHMDLSPPT